MNAPQRYSPKRATDIMPVSVIGSAATVRKIGDYGLDLLMADLKVGMRCACVKAYSQERKSCSAMLVYQGRMTGCMYSSDTIKDMLPTHEALRLMMDDLALPDTVVEIHDLPEPVVLAQSALFIGHPVKRSDSLGARDYIDYIRGVFKTENMTGALVISLPSNQSTCLFYIYKGNHCGAFHIDEQRFSRDIGFVYELLSKDPKASVEASYLPDDRLLAVYLST